MLLTVTSWLLLVISLWLLAGARGDTGLVFGWGLLLLDLILWLCLLSPIRHRDTWGSTKR